MNNNSKTANEWQFDGLVGPTHNYAGLAFGNLAAAINAGAESNPRQAALQGLQKMKFVRDLGVPQALFPPHLRPIIPVLKQVGFGGGIKKILEDSARQAPPLLAAAYSSAFMWTANAATVTPSADSADGKVHFTPANLISHFHRSLEASFTAKSLRRIFKDGNHFAVHDPLPSATPFSDEGAANHMLATAIHGQAGLHVFVYGIGGKESLAPRKYPARQQAAAFEAIARSHKIPAEQTLFVQQSPQAIDAGCFHNDVIAMNTTSLMLAHETAFTDREAVRAAMLERGFDYIEITEDQLSLAEAVQTYFFNSQLLELNDGRFVIVAPGECEQHAKAAALLDSLSSGNGPISAVHYRDVRESMRNGGGPACLRLRVVLTEKEAAAIHPGVVLTDALFDRLTAWVKKHYRDRLSFADFADPLLVGELEDCYAELSGILDMPDLYDL